jgi:hypothetical protein
MEESRLAALRLINADTLLVKQTDQPVAFKLNVTDPLSDAQMRLLALASPWNHIIVHAHMGEWSDALQAYNTTITAIETPPRDPVLKHTKTLRWGLRKRKRGFISHD